LTRADQPFNEKGADGMAMLNRGGVGIYYEVTGTQNGKTPVLLSHGMSATTEMWEPNLPALAAGRQVITWDIRGHGRSDSPDDQALYTEAHCVADMAAILDALGIERAVIGGLSLGGYLSLAFNLAYPGRATALMLFDTGPGYRRDEPRQRWNDTVAVNAKRMEDFGLDALSGSDEVAGAKHRGISGLIRAQRGIMPQFDGRVIESLPGISVPTLVLVGADDDPFLAAAEYMAAHIPNAKKVVLDDAGHASNMHQPTAFNRAVLEFLDSI
jgi:pimeloyl-ACP methyl ester carboxylesterase